MTYINLGLAILASFRFTQLVTEDSVFNPVRKLFQKRPGVLLFFSCTRCISVWTGLLAVAIYAYFPLANWPFAFSFLFSVYLIALDTKDTIADKKTPKIVIRCGLNGTNTELFKISPRQAKAVLSDVIKTSSGWV